MKLLISTTYLSIRFLMLKADYKWNFENSFLVLTFKSQVKAFVIRQRCFLGWLLGQYWGSCFLHVMLYFFQGRSCLNYGPDFREKWNNLNSVRKAAQHLIYFWNNYFSKITCSLFVISLILEPIKKEDFFHNSSRSLSLCWNQSHFLVTIFLFSAHLWSYHS